MRGTAWWWLALVPLVAAGCGGGGNSLTAGGVPMGRAVIEGTVVDALDSGSPVPGARVTLAVDTARSRGITFTSVTRTDAEGAFTFQEVPEGEATVLAVRSGDGQGRPAEARVSVRGTDTASVAIALEPEDEPSPTVVSLVVSPERIDAVVGVPVTVSAVATLSDGRQVRPSWVVEGGVGKINSAGRFLPRRAGTGSIRVRAGDLVRIIPVTVTGQDGSDDD